MIIMLVTSSDSYKLIIDFSNDAALKLRSNTSFPMGDSHYKGMVGTIYITPSESA